MKYFRATVRLIALFIVTAGYYSCWRVGAFFLSRYPNGTRNWRKQTFGGWARTTARVVGMKLQVRNAPPATPFLLVTNHLSYTDIVVIESQVDCAFIAKREVANWPVLGSVCSNLNTIFVDRGKKCDLLNVITRAGKILDQGYGVALFAEGTSSEGETVGPFRSSLLELAIRRRIPVHYATITYAGPPGADSARQAICWWGDMTFPDHVFRLLQLPWFEASIVFGREPISSGDRRELAAELWTAVNSQFIPVTDRVPSLDPS